MSELLGLSHPPAGESTGAPQMPNSAGMHAKLVKADFHVSIMTGEVEVSWLCAIVEYRNSEAKQESLSCRAFWNCSSRDRKCIQGYHGEESN